MDVNVYNMNATIARTIDLKKEKSLDIFAIYTP